MGDISSILWYTIFRRNIMITVAFFGHRRTLNKAVVQERLLNTLQEVLPQGCSKLLIGTHGDFDNIALSTCLYFKKYIRADIDINVVLTSTSFLNKDSLGYSKADFYKNKGCKTIFYDIEEVYYKSRITYSNKKMVDESDIIICCVDMNLRKSGAKTAINYAIKQNKTVINLFSENYRFITQ